ncbi:MAG: TlyA family RNA methyltransferase [Deltaproteobacteria bacterium]|nr:TlyA family RNA methyltransferase [Deltaproteobacteria bacterium]
MQKPPFHSKPKFSGKVSAAVLLVETRLASSPKEASALIYAGKVLANEQRVEKPGQLLAPQVKLRVKGTHPSFVSRGGIKLHAAIKELGLTEKFRDKVVLDTGASTGGFTDCVLQLGARAVLALDVGTNQLAWSLRSHPRVTALENTDIREWDPQKFPPLDWIIADISFNSLAKLAPAFTHACSKTTECLLLVKPQFELPYEKVPQGGIVTEARLWQEAVTSVVEAFRNLGAHDFLHVKSSLTGREGNQEFFLYFNLDPHS